VARLEISSPGELEVEDVIAADGSLSLAPIFYGRGREPATAAIIKVKDDSDEVVHLYALKIIGSTLQLSLHDRTKPVKALYEKRRSTRSG